MENPNAYCHQTQCNAPFTITQTIIATLVLDIVISYIILLKMDTQLNFVVPYNNLIM